MTTGSFAPAGAVVPVGGLTGAKLTFEVPVGATFSAGNAMARFCLSPDGGLAADSQLGTPPFGEIEDYKFPLGQIGNIVFEDRDFDGLQDAGEPGIDGVNVMLTWAGANGTIGDSDDVMYQTTTGPVSGQDAGEYYVSGLINGTYKLKFTTPANMTPTRSEIGGQVNGSTVDSDGSITGMDLSMAMETFTISDVTNMPTNENGLGDASPAAVGTFPDAQTDETHDQGFAFLDYVTTSRAKNKIRNVLNEDTKKIAEEGKELLTRKLKHLKITLNEGVVNELVVFFKLKTSLDLFYRIGIGAIENQQLKDYAAQKSNTLINFFKNKIKRSPSSAPEDINRCLS